MYQDTILADMQPVVQGLQAPLFRMATQGQVLTPALLWAHVDRGFARLEEKFVTLAGGVRRTEEDKKSTNLAALALGVVEKLMTAMTVGPEALPEVKAAIEMVRAEAKETVEDVKRAEREAEAACERIKALQQGTLLPSLLPVQRPPVDEPPTAGPSNARMPQQSTISFGSNLGFAVGPPPNRAAPPSTLEPDQSTSEKKAFEKFKIYQQANGSWVGECVVKCVSANCTLICSKIHQGKHGAFLQAQTNVRSHLSDCKRNRELVCCTALP